MRRERIGGQFISKEQKLFRICTTTIIFGREKGQTDEFVDKERCKLLIICTIQQM